METEKVASESGISRASSMVESRAQSDLEEANSKPCKQGTTDIIRQRYASLLAKHPWIAFLTTFLMVLLAGTTGFVKELGAKPLPTFSSPGKGFEARGTLISKRILAFNNLFDEMPGIDRLPTSSYVPSLHQSLSSTQNNSECTHEVLPYLHSKTVYTTLEENGDLFNAKNLKVMCKLEDELVRREPLFAKECVKGPYQECCPSLSIGYYAALVNNKGNCSEITDDDVSYLKNLTIMVTSKQGGVQPIATLTPSFHLQIATYVVKFMVDKTFAANPSSAKLTYALVFSPLQMPKREFLENIYKEKLQKEPLPQDGNVKLMAYDFENLKTVAYDSQLIADVWYIMLAVGLILGLMWCYSGSLFISIMGFSSVVFAIILSYWFYSVVFGLVFFPFLNIMTTIFVVGIGADDIFVYVLAWRHARQQYAKSLPDVDTITKCTEYALQHATAAMFVTSFTTATAFYAGLSSSITALQCFSIFAGTSILTNYFLMITWLPAVIVAQERFFAPSLCKPVAKTEKQIHPGTSALSVKELETAGHRKRPCFPLDLSEVRDSLKRYSDVIFQQWIAKIVVRLRYCWLVLFFILALFGMLSLTFYPKLSLPTTQQMPLFIEDHSIEKYDSVVKSKLQIEEVSSTKGIRFPIIFVWGVRSVDNGYFLNPDSTGKTEWDHSFMMEQQENQLWMLKFCAAVKNASLYDQLRNENNWCFMEDFNKYVNRPCRTNQTCCNKTLPLSPDEFKRCTKEYVNSQSEQNLPVKLNSDGSIRALTFRFHSNQEYLLKYGPVETFWKETKKWSEKVIADMPKPLQNCWVISNLYFYDLQRSIADGTIKTIAVSIGISAMVLLATTQNILITLYAVIAITAIISVTIGSLVMAGWRLNVLESMMMSVAIGLSIDFTLHYGVAYFSCEDTQSRKERVYYSLWHVGSAVAMGTLTTFLAGLVMMPSVIHAYIQVGHFLMLIMSTSWVYSTFFFLALCAVLGPQGHVGHIIHCWKKKNKTTPQADSSGQELETR